MNKILENTNLNMSLADATYLRWYEITNALSHSHMDAIFNRFRQVLESEMRKTGEAKLTTATVIASFQIATQKVARIPLMRRFESTAQDEEEAA